MNPVAQRLQQVRERIQVAAERAGRDPETVRLLAVSKTHPVEAIVEAYGAGQRDFGENYVQELTAKAEALAHLSDLRWHLIGHLQRNKVKQAIRYANAIHSVHSAELAAELGRRHRALFGPDQPPSVRRILIEVNIGREPQKSGVDPEQLEPVVSAVAGESGLELRGLMCVPPISDDPEKSLPYFQALAQLRDRHGGAERLPELSMGMTFDLEPAIRAGATLVRVGTAIFGERPAKTVV